MFPYNNNNNKNYNRISVYYYTHETRVRAYKRRRRCRHSETCATRVYLCGKSPTAKPPCCCTYLHLYNGRRTTGAIRYYSKVSFRLSIVFRCGDEPDEELYVVVLKTVEPYHPGRLQRTRQIIPTHTYTCYTQPCSITRGDGQQCTFFVSVSDGCWLFRGFSLFFQ